MVITTTLISSPYLEVSYIFTDWCWIRKFLITNRHFSSNTGDVTLGVYTDSSCLEESQYSFADYQNVYGGSLTASGSYGAFNAFNANMNVYKTCQPCRAYNREKTYGRQLTEYNDGQGGYESNNYNCFDDADYLNCNQCYKVSS